jgi:hypothetical protein
MIDKLKDILGPKCTAINVNGEISEFINVPSTRLKFCEAVNCSFNIPIRLNDSNLGVQVEDEALALIVMNHFQTIME